MKALLDRGASLDLLNEGGSSPLNEARIHGRSEIEQLLLAHGAAPASRLQSAFARVPAGLLTYRFWSNFRTLCFGTMFRDELTYWSAGKWTPHQIACVVNFLRHWIRGQFSVTHRTLTPQVAMVHIPKCAGNSLLGWGAGCPGSRARILAP